MAATVWCLESLQELLTNGVSKDYCRKYRGSNMVLLLDTFSNKKGIFLKVTKLFNGALKNIILPAGSYNEGWRRMRTTWWENGFGHLRGVEFKFVTLAQRQML